MLNLSFKKIILFFITLSLVCGLIFWESLLIKGSELGLNFFFSKSLEGEFSYDAISFKEGQWILENPVFHSKPSSNRDSIVLVAKRALVKITPSFWKRELTIAVQLLNSQLTLDQDLTQLQQKLKNQFQSSTLFTIHFHLLVEQSQLNLCNYDYSPPTCQTFFYQLELIKGVNTEGSLTISLEDTTLKENYMKILFSQAAPSTVLTDPSAPLVLNFNFDAVKCSSLTQCLEKFYPLGDQLIIQEGVITGKIDLRLCNQAFHQAFNEVQEIEGTVRISNLDFMTTQAELKGRIKEAKLKINKGQESRENINCAIEFLSGSSIQLRSEKEQSYNLSELKGQIFFNLHSIITQQAIKQIKLNLLANCKYRNLESRLKAKGAIDFNLQEENSANLTIGLSLPDKKETVIHLQTKGKKSELNVGKIRVAHVGSYEFDLISHLVAPYFPAIKQLEMKQGELNGLVRFDLKERNLTHLKIKEIASQQLSFLIKPWEAIFTIQELTGSLDLDLEARKNLESVCAQLTLHKGTIRLEKKDQIIHLLSEIEAQVVIHQGKVLKSLITGEFAGLKGQVDLKDLTGQGDFSDKQVFNLSLVGETKGLAKFAPDPIAQALDTHFAAHQIQLQATVKKKAKGLKVTGDMTLGTSEDNLNQVDKQTIDKQKIAFGFYLEKVMESLTSSPPLLDSYEEEIALETTLTYFPNYVKPVLFQSQWLLKDFKIPGIRLTQGWFNAQEMPLNKYLAPFIFTSTAIKMQGTGDFKGHFDQQKLNLNYILQDLQMENDNFILASPSLSLEIAASSKNLKGSHLFNFMTGASNGALTLDQATYLDKNSELLFTELCTEISLKGRKIQFEELKTRCCDLSFSGKAHLDLDLPGENEFQAFIHIKEVQGQFSQLQEYLSHFPKLTFFRKFPLEGEIGLGKQGIELSFIHAQDKITFNSMIDGYLENGNFSFCQEQVKGENLSFKFNFDQAAKTLAITAIEGDLLLSKEEHTNQYDLRGDHFNFTNLLNNEATFDLALEDKNQNTLRFVGHTFNQEDAFAQETIGFKFNRSLTHCGTLYPTILELSLKEWTKLEFLEMACQVDIKNLKQNLHEINLIEFLCVPLSIPQNLQQTAGTCAINLHYDAHADLLNYHLTGEKIQINDYFFETCSLHGNKKDVTWSIDQLVLDDLTLAADLAFMPQGLKFDFLGLRYGESLLAGLEGEYLYDTKMLEAKINLLELSLPHLQEWPALKNVVVMHQPKGQLRANGQLKLKFHPDLVKGWHLDALVNGNLKNLEMRGIPFDEATNISFHFSSDRGLILRNMKTHFKDPLSKKNLGYLSFEKIEHLMAQEELIFDQLFFKIPVENLRLTAELLQKTFPEAIQDSLIAVISEIKGGGQVEGSFSMIKNPLTTSLHFTLEEGAYRFFNADHQVSHFNLSYDLKELKILTQYNYQNHLFWLLAKVQGPQFDTGTLLFSDHHPEIETSKNAPLLVSWKTDLSQGLQISKAKGYFAGLEVNLNQSAKVPNTPKAFYLDGHVMVYPQKVMPLLSQDLLDMIKKWKIGHNCLLTGRFMWSKEKESPEKELKIYFQGDLEAQHFTFQGYRFQKLLTQLSYMPNRIELRDLKVEDPAGNLTIAKLNLFQDKQNSWKFDMPFLSISNFRPSLLREMHNRERLIPKPLLIRKMEFEQLKGNCGDKNSVTGKGKLVFINPPKKNLHNTILAIPAEILTLIGLDLTVLNPISGTVLYTIQGGKIYLSKFKDVYSEGKLSKFNLNNRKEPCYVDFDGNICMQIRMKQYNLFFKLAELFTVSIGGNLKKPSYSLYKQR